MKTLERDIHTIDAQGKVPGRLATTVVHLLIGKHKPSFTPNVDAGDYVQVTNASKMKIHPVKEAKIYYRHTTYASGLKMRTLKGLMASDPSKVLREAVSRMLPKNKQRSPRLKRLTIKN
ncbi:50S ribosomal protein L13 [Candidatus Uhrbacteria bacterium]|nr:50S ribosomal protein L13 [Candidatus Uhrbacteria bacterium]